MMKPKFYKNKYLIVLTTNDDLELPVYVADNVADLAKQTKKKKAVLFSLLAHKIKTVKVNGYSRLVRLVDVSQTFDLGGENMSDRKMQFLKKNEITIIIRKTVNDLYFKNDKELEDSWYEFSACLGMVCAEPTDEAISAFVRYIDISKEDDARKELELYL